MDADEMLLDSMHTSQYELLLENFENESILIKFEETFLQSYNILETSRKVNIIAVVLVIIIGLAGHFLTVFVFGQKRFRTNSSNVYLLCLAINDSLFLVVHFFEDTIRTYQDVFLSENIKSNSTLGSNSNDLIRFLNITDKFDFTCRLINYLRYVLRFISVNIIVAYTIQRLIIVTSPFSNQCKSKKAAWVTVSLISIFSFLFNLWVPFVFEIKNEEFKQYCDVKKAFKNEYFILAVVYITVTIGMPITVIFISNSIIAIKAVKAEAKRGDIKLKKTSLNNSKTETVPTAPTIRNKSYQLTLHGKESLRSVQQTKPYYVTVNQMTSRQMRRNKSSKHIAKVLSLISMSFVVLNMPYLITWSLFYYNIIYQKIENESTHNYLYAAVKVSEIFYILNYAMLFFIYCASGSKFRAQLKFSG